MHCPESSVEKTKNMNIKKRVGLVAHDGRKKDLMEWVKFNEGTLSRHQLFATGTTGHLLMQACPSLDITCFKSGPLGGDQQLGALIAEGGLDVLIFLTDPMTSQPHDVDVKALTRLSTVYNIVLAMTRSTADFVINSEFFDRRDYAQLRENYAAYIHRQPTK
jgi:methylglyoxal synthase